MSPFPKPEKKEKWPREKRLSRAAKVRLPYNAQFDKRMGRVALMGRADLLCAITVKKRDDYRCTLCGSRSDVQWAHILSRSHKLVRHDLENSTTLCERCHWRWTNDKDGWDALRRQLMGDERFNALWARAKADGKPDYAAVILYLENVPPDCPRPWSHVGRER